MNHFSQLYWLTRLDYIRGGLISFFCVACAALVVLLFYVRLDRKSVPDDEDNIKRKRKAIRWHRLLIYFIMLVSFSGIILCPSKDEAIFIMVGSKTMDFAEQDSSLNKIPAQSTKLITDLLSKAIKDLNK